MKIAPRDRRVQRSFGAKSLLQIEGKLAALGLRLGMTLDRPPYVAAVTAALVGEKLT